MMWFYCHIFMLIHYQLCPAKEVAITQVNCKDSMYIARVLATCWRYAVYMQQQVTIFRKTQISQKSSSSLKFLGARTVTWSKRQAENPQILGTTTHTYTHIHTYLRSCLHTCTHTYIHTDTHTHTHTSTYVHSVFVIGFIVCPPWIDT